jgi:MraZ protein
MFSLRYESSWVKVLFCGSFTQFQSKPLMTGFLGEYDVSMDAKGRFLLPAGFRKQLPEGSGERFVINRGFEGCLTMYTLDKWEREASRIRKFDDFNEVVRRFKRLFFNGASFVDVDSAGRILLPKTLAESVKITKDIVLSVQDDRVEIWDKDTYYKYMDAHIGEYSDLANQISRMRNPFENMN